MSVPEVGLYDDATPDEQIAYCMGWNTARAIDRATAFGAIRRAAEVARHHDQRHADWLRNGVQDLADQQWFAADSVRRAIRAAIGSDKS